MNQQVLKLFNNKMKKSNYAIKGSKNVTYFSKNATRLIKS